MNDACLHLSVIYIASFSVNAHAEILTTKDNHPGLENYNIHIRTVKASELV